MYGFVPTGTRAEPVAKALHGLGRRSRKASFTACEVEHTSAELYLTPGEPVSFSGRCTAPGVDLLIAALARAGRAGTVEVYDPDTGELRHQVRADGTSTPPSPATERRRNS
ncbi:hypothetical protein [Kitasatospora cheerisanensis]|uniref:hypothetical protein n=1 Tax=Kitasatospora cheerisanensis TaxID=81942 RepID=UPI000AAB658D|nr:hypothetical protein [Kitasatospora cheerisanensis]